MSYIDLMTEYNPFHNGHAYQIAKAKEMTGADYCIIAMCGDFVQRRHDKRFQLYGLYRV